VLHKYPEPGFEERRTSKFLRERLENAGYEISFPYGKTGFIATLKGKKPGKSIAVRADMDALSLQEENEFEFASQNKGVMHACGHDGHMAMAVSAAELLIGIKEEIAGDVHFTFQPAEEGIGGAESMILDGVLEKTKPDIIFGLHLWTPIPFGKIIVTPGAFMASVDDFDITITGKGGHGAIPHETRDPIVMASQVVTALQTVVSGCVSSVESAVVSICSVHAGTTFNIIPEKVEMKGTLRTFDLKVRECIMEKMHNIINGITSAAAGSYKLDFHYISPPVVNDAGIAGKIREIASEIVGKENILTDEQTMAGEDFSRFLQQVPGCLSFIGAGPVDGKNFTPHHSPRFTFDEDALAVGTDLILRFIKRNCLT